MPWSPEDATRHTKKAQSPTAQKQWSDVANSALESGKPEGDAVRIANGVVKKRRRGLGLAKAVGED